MASKNKYGLLTCIAMIVGVVVGSGIFFKSDNILIATNGNIFLGVLAFCIAAISIIFGSLTVAELAARNDKPGGIITYAEDAYNGGIACAFGWFQTFLYYPALIAVVSYVVGIYVCMLFNISATLEINILIGLITTFILFAINASSRKLAGYFQTSSTFIKLIPLILIVFAFDGWIVSTAISHEVKNAKRNVPLALVCAPLAILIIYVLYFIGLSTYLGPEILMTTGDQHVEIAASKLFGPWAAKGILAFVTISVIGTANGLMMGLTQLPYSLAIRGMFPNSKKVATFNEKLGIPVISYLVSLILVLFWTAAHYIVSKYDLLPGSDVSEIAITLNYVLFILLYAQVLRLGFKGEIKGFFKGKFNPVLAIIGSLIILYVGLLNPLFLLYLFLCTVLLVSAYLFWLKTRKA